MKKSTEKVHIYAFTLVEIMVVVAILSLLAAIAIPAFARARTRASESTCMRNLREIETAKSQWALDRKKGPGAQPKDKELFGPTRYLREKPECPSGGTYDVNKLKEAPTCSFPGHYLE
jgi:prepilin-type N-terminal cleavage/methylation domain-containing protein